MAVYRRRQWHPTPVLLPGKSHGWRSLVGCSPRGLEESDTTERLNFHFSLSCIGEGNGHPLQCSGLENPGEGGAQWAAIYGVAQSRTRLKQLSSSSSSMAVYCPSQYISSMACSRIIKLYSRELPGDSVVRTSCFHYWGLGSILNQGTKIPQVRYCCQKKNKLYLLLFCLILFL